MTLNYVSAWREGKDSSYWLDVLCLQSISYALLKLEVDVSIIVYSTTTGDKVVVYEIYEGRCKQINEETLSTIARTRMYLTIYNNQNGANAHFDPLTPTAEFPVNKAREVVKSFKLVLENPFKLVFTKADELNDFLHHPSLNQQRISKMEFYHFITIDKIRFCFGKLILHTILKLILF